MANNGRRVVQNGGGVKRKVIVSTGGRPCPVSHLFREHQVEGVNLADLAWVPCLRLGTLN